MIGLSGFCHFSPFFASFGDPPCQVISIRVVVELPCGVLVVTGGRCAHGTQEREAEGEEPSRLPWKNDLDRLEGGKHQRRRAMPCPGRTWCFVNRQRLLPLRLYGYVADLQFTSHSSNFQLPLLTHSFCIVSHHPLITGTYCASVFHHPLIATMFRRLALAV